MAQIAGRVAILPKGKWSSDVTYSKLDLVYYDNASYVARKSSTNVIPADDTETWMLVLKGIDEQLIDDILNGTTPVGDSASLGGETAEAWQNKLDTIQATSIGTLSQAGWYRVAEYVGNAYQQRGIYVPICDIALRRVNSIDNTYIKLSFGAITDSFNFNITESKSVSHVYSKIRYVKDTNLSKAYIEIYCNTASVETVVVLNAFGNDSYPVWQAITPTLTSESVEGVTVTTTYDIPANASPVTDLDLGLAAASTTVLGSVTSLDDLDDYRGVNGYVNVEIAGNYQKVLVLSTNPYSTIQISLSVYDKILKYRFTYSPSGLSWSEWNTPATTSDLANYLALDGSSNTLRYSATDINNFMSGIVVVHGEVCANLPEMAWFLVISGGYVGTNVQVAFHLSTSNRCVYKRMCASGTWSAWNKMNFDDYLPLDGSKAMTSHIKLTYNNGEVGADGNHAFLKAKTAQSETDYRTIQLLNRNHTSDIRDALKLYDSHYTSYRIFHEGNSSAVISSATAPSDTSALWYDTTNKVLKRYVDGAWQQ